MPESKNSENAGTNLAQVAGVDAKVETANERAIRLDISHVEISDVLCAHFRRSRETHVHDPLD